MQNQNFLTVEKIAERNTRNRLLLSIIFALLSIDCYLSTKGKSSFDFICSLIYPPIADKNIIYFSPLRHSLSGRLARNINYVNEAFTFFAVVLAFFALYNLIKALSGSIDYKNSDTYKQLYQLMGNIENNEQLLDYELEKYEITDFPKNQNLLIMDIWTLEKRFLKTRFSLNEQED